MKTVLFCIWQWTWGLPQTLIGLIVYLIYRKCPHDRFHGATVTYWGKRSSMGTGMFLFIGEAENPKINQQLLVHEYGHAVQSLLLGPLILPIMGIPSFLWAMLPPCRRLRREKGISYYAFYPESSANRLGQRATRRICTLR